MVKNIAGELGCSVQPIYSYCRNIHGLRREVTELANHFVQDFVAQRLNPTAAFPSLGRAYLELAKTEPHLFKIFIFQPREGIASLDQLYEASASPGIARRIAESLGVSLEAARNLHLDMLIYTLGLGVAFASASPGIPADEVFSRQDRAYEAFLHYAREEKK